MLKNITLSAISSILMVGSAHPPNTPYVLVCSGTTEGSTGSVGSGDDSVVHGSMPFRYEYLIDPVKKTVTRRAFVNAEGEHYPAYFSSDIRAFSPKQIIFCEDSEFSCRPGKKPWKSGTMERRVGLVVLDLSASTLSADTALTVDAPNGTSVYLRSVVSGSCRVKADPAK